MLQFIVFAGIIINILGTLAYIKSTLKGITKPNRATWLLWGIAPLIATAAAFTDGVRLAVLPVLMMGLLPLAVFIASFVNPKSYWKLEKFDYLCGICTFLGLILWVVTKEPILAIIFAIISDTFAALPTVIKSWKYPETETSTPYITSMLSALTSFLVITTWNVSAYAFPVYLVFVNSLIILALYRKKFMKQQN